MHEILAENAKYLNLYESKTQASKYRVDQTLNGFKFIQYFNE